VGMIQGSDRSRLLLEEGHTVGLGDQFRQYLDRNFATQSSVARAIHDTHRAGSQKRENLKLSQLRTRGQGHDPAHYIRKIIAKRAGDINRARQTLPGCWLHLQKVDECRTNEECSLVAQGLDWVHTRGPSCRD